jgi:hypothetical protein
LTEAITVEGFDAGTAWKVTVESTNIDTVSLELLLEPMRHRCRFVTATSFGSGPDGDIFSTWPVGYNGPRWVIIVLSDDVRTMALRQDGLDRSISPVRIASGRIPQLGIMSMTNHPAQVDFYGAGEHLLGKLRLDEPRLRRDGKPLDLTAPAPIGQQRQILGN